ncbi:hypothetical protein [Natronomonas sp. EA1]|uniref:hypothetical protein n=1 Tax=Natronomonas sp. EA1 TaxID=3421655 RepID=UPI003EBBBAFD
MVIRVPVSDRFMDAAVEWGDYRMLDEQEALETKAEQALLEIEHLVSGSHEVAFDVEGEELVLYPSDELERLLAAQSESTGLSEAAVLSLHVDLFARVFLEEVEADAEV